MTIKSFLFSFFFLIIIFSSFIFPIQATGFDSYYNSFDSNNTLQSDGFINEVRQGTNITFEKSPIAAYNGTKGLLFQSTPSNGPVQFHIPLNISIQTGNYLSFYAKRYNFPTNIRIELYNGSFSMFLDIGQDPSLNWEPNDYISNTATVFTLASWKFYQYNLTYLAYRSLHLNDAPPALNGFTPQFIVNFILFQDVSGQQCTLYLDDLRFSSSSFDPNSTSSTSPTNSIPQILTTTTANGLTFEVFIIMLVTSFIIRKKFKNN